MKRNKKEKNYFEKGELENLLIIILIFGLVFSVWQVVNALHNLDLIYNFNGVACNLGINPETITDIASDGISRPLEDYYIQSMNDLRKYVLFSIFISLIIGYLIGGLNGTRNIKKNRRKNR